MPDQPPAFIARMPGCNCVVGSVLTSITAREVEIITNGWRQRGYDVRPGSVADTRRLSLCPIALETVTEGAG